MPLHFVQLKLDKKTYKAQVSTEGCSYVDDFRDAIKKKFSPELDSYAPHHLTLFQPDGTTEIDPGETVEKLNEFKVGPWNPLVVIVEELPTPAPTGSSKKQITYKAEASCRKYFDALAEKLALFYKFDYGGEDSSFPTIGDVFNAVGHNTWKYRKRQKTVEERLKEDGFVEPPSKVPILDIPLPSLFADKDWKRLKELNRKTNDRIHDASLPKERGKFFIILPNDELNDDTISLFKRIGVNGKMFAHENDLVVKDIA